MKRSGKSNKRHSVKMKRRELQLTGQTVQNQNEETRGKVQTVGGLVFALLLSCLLSFLMLQGLLLDFCRTWDVEYQRGWMASLALVSVAAAVVFGIGKRFRLVPMIAAVAFAMGRSFL